MKFEKFTGYFRRCCTDGDLQQVICIVQGCCFPFSSVALAELRSSGVPVRPSVDLGLLKIKKSKYCSPCDYLSVQRHRTLHFATLVKQITMKILKRQINGRGIGFAKLEAEEDEDMYHLYNLICKGDTLEAMTVRNVSTCQLYAFYGPGLTSELRRSSLKVNLGHVTKTECR